MGTTAISATEREQLISEIEQLCAENDEAMGLPPSTSPGTSPASFAWAAFGLGLGLGAAVVAIAGSLV